MKLKLDQPLRDFDGNPIKNEKNEIITLNHPCQIALTFDDPKNPVEGAERVERFSLALRLHKANKNGKVVNLSIEEAAKIKLLLGRCPILTTIAVGQACLMLEGKSTGLDFEVEEQNEEENVEEFFKD